MQRRESSRRRAQSNYIRVENEPALAHLQSFRGLNANGNANAPQPGTPTAAQPSTPTRQQQYRQQQHDSGTPPAGRAPPPPTTTDIFETLQAKFGFQRSSVENQKEHFVYWLTNYQLRVQHEQIRGSTLTDIAATRIALGRVHKKFFKNYVWWCKFLRTKPYLAGGSAKVQHEQQYVDDANSALVMEKQLALFLLIWGEAGNMRFMPECICFLYHSMANKLDEVEYLPNVEEGFYLTRIVRPIYDVISIMRTAAAPEGAKPLDHQDVTNYDDVNEFFWTTECLDFDELNVAEALKVHDPKTFKEKRSLFNPLLAFFRIWFFLVVMFHVLFVIAYVSYRADNSDSGGLSFYGNFFSTSQTDLRAHAIYSIFVTITGLLALKVGLQMWLYGMRIFKDAWLVIGVFFRLFWHTFFFALFVLVNVSPSESALFGSKSSILSGGGDSGTYLSMGLLYVIVYSIPVVFSAFLRMFCAHGIWSIRILNGLDGTRRQYIGRKMAQPWAAYSQYALSWMVIFVCKFAFNLQFMVKPLVGPSIVVYDIAISDEQRSNGIIESNHNIAFIIALWVPVFVVYMYDSQIYFILFQTIVGLVMGIRMKLGHYIDLPQLKAGLYAAPDQFDLRVTTTQAKLVQQEPAIVSGSGKVDGIDHVRLRFAIIWNEVISNFRLNDLLDDRETVMLQYRILGKGEQIEDPIFLLAGSLTKAITLASSTSTNKWDTQSLIKNFENAKILDGVKDGLYLLREIFTLLLGDADEQDGAVSVLEHLFNSPDIVSMIDFSHLPELADEIEELLGTILDMPEDLAAFEDNNPAYQSARIEFQVQVGQVTQSVRNTFKIMGKMLNDGSLVRKLENCKFLQFTPDLGYQKQQLLSLYQADVLLQNGFFSAHRRENDESCASSSRFAREDFVSGCTRLFILMRLDVANSLPRCDEAKRRMGFFLHSLAMDMPQVQCLEAMPSFSVMTPYYSETVLFTLDELKNPVHSNPLFEAIDKKATVKGRSELSIIKYLVALHAEEWSNFLERMSVGTLEEAIATVPMQVRLWASLRGQTLARTVQGMMMYEDAIRLLRWLELYAVAGMNEDTKAYEMSRISALKFSYITGCQIYSQQVAKGDHRADDIDFLMKKYPSWRVSFVDTIKDNGATRFDCVLVKSEGDEIVEVYRYELPGNPILGEGKPENQNVALPFTRGEYLQTIDMNQEHYFEETLKMPNFLATATSSGEEVTIIGMKEHVFTGRASSLARFMTQQELVFVTLTQRVLARPLRARMHYGHPDVFEKSFVMTSGGVSKASKGINLSEDVFSGYNVTLRGGLVTHVEFMQCGKGRDVTLSQINAFEAKLSNGCAESCLSREGHRMSNNLDFFRLNSMFYGHFGFYICNALTVLCVYIYAYAKLYVATHEEIQISAVMTSNSLNSLATVMSTQYILQFGMLTTLPLLATLVVEFGLKEASFRVLELISTLGIVFYVFLTGTKAHFYDVALIRGGSKYRGTGRGFAITRDPMVNFFKEYNVSHFRKAVELIGVMILFGMCGNFNIGAGVRAEYCASVDFCDDSPDLIPANITALDSYSRSPQGYGVASFAVLLLGACWLMAPFLFNTDGLVLNKTNIDISNWFAWMMRVKQDDDLIEDDDKNSSGVPKDGWLEWWAADVDLMSNLGPMGRATYCLRELRHPLAMYYVFITEFSLTDMIWLIAAIIFIWIGLVLGGVAIQSTLGKKQKLAVLTVRGIVYMAVVVGGLGIVPIIIGGVAGWYVTKSLVLSSAIFLGLNSICQFALALHGVYGFPLALTRPVVALGFLFDMLVGVFLVVPLLALSFLPFMRILQSRMLYNGGFSRALSSGSEVAASLVIILGLVAGFVHGFMTCFVYGLGYLNSSSDNFVNSSFHYFVSNSLSDSARDHLLTWMKDGYLKTVCAGASIVAVLASLALSRFFGRRWSMVSGCACIGSSMVLNFISSSSVIILACALGASGTAVLSMNYLMYSFEICTKGWRGKSVVLYLLGSMLGYLVHALMQKSVDASTLSTGSKDKPTNDWRVAPLYVAAPLTILLCGILKFMPESPVWLIRHNHQKHARRVLARLRQREDVQMDMALIEEELKAPVTKENNLAFRIAFVFVLQILVGLLMSQGLLLREQLRESSESSGPRYSNWLVYFSICSASGLSFGIFLVDNVRRKTILKEFLPFVGLLSLFCGVSGSLANGQSGFVQAMLFIMYIAAGLSLLSAAWLSAMEMFPTSNRPLLFTTSLCVFHLTEAIVFFTRPSFAATHFIFCILCGAVTAVLFMFCASTKTGAIQLKTEKKRQKEAQAAADAAAIVAAGLNDAQAQGDNQLHFRRQQSRFTRNNSANVSRRVPYLDPTGESSDNIMSADGSVNFDESSSGSRSPKAPYVTRVSDSFDLIDEFDGLDDSRTQNLLTHEISYPVQQPRSVSFLRSQSFPDADIKTETLYKKL